MLKTPSPMDRSGFRRGEQTKGSEDDPWQPVHPVDGVEGQEAEIYIYKLDISKLPLAKRLNERERRYAPSKANNHPYYIRIHYSGFSGIRDSIYLEGSKPPLEAGDDFFFISLKFLNDYARNRLDVDGLRNEYDPTPDDDDVADDLLSMDLINLLKEISIPPSLNCKTFPVRGRRGNVYWVRTQMDLGSAGFQKLLKGVWDAYQKLPPPSTSWRGRYEDIVLPSKLYIYVQEAIALSRFKTLDEKALRQKFLDHIGIINNKRAGTILGLLDVGKKELEEDYVPISNNPFGLYTTYLTNADYQAYMESLYDGSRTTFNAEHHATGTVPTATIQNPPPLATESCNATRPFPSKEEKKLHAIREFFQSSNCRRKTDLSASQKAGSKTVMNDQSDSEGRRIQSLVQVPVSSNKIGNAKGMRDSQNQPRKILGFSASEFAAEHLGWQNHQKNDARHDFLMNNSLYIAEWLHMSAFSWGGLLDLSTPSQHSSSDVPENLVLGTSETNSYMTRYEKAWQQLVLDEANECGQPDFNGTLTVCRNAERTPGKFLARMDRFKNGNYIVQDALFPKDSSIEKISKEVTILAYNICYEIVFKSESKILSMEAGVGLSTWFYPFMRPFYHTLEAKLDNALYKDMKDRMKEEQQRAQQKLFAQQHHQQTATQGSLNIFSLFNGIQNPGYIGNHQNNYQPNNQFSRW
ncbi:hypothetical protein TWF718_007687 [Orbilia javanica]|uniref:Uncharacterized protein n=1 Tax=Orbilia javanica TaxID=47235 RepID=A0AAN8N7A2_9PEZI